MTLTYERKANRDATFQVVGKTLDSPQAVKKLAESAENLGVSFGGTIFSAVVGMDKSKYHFPEEYGSQRKMPYTDISEVPFVDDVIVESCEDEFDRTIARALPGLAKLAEQAWEEHLKGHSEKLP